MNIPKIITAAEAAAMINNGELLGVGGFGPAARPSVSLPP